MITLAPEQQRIVNAPLDGPHLVDAGAGTGKTTTLVERAVALVQRGACLPAQILVTTFTNAAAAEIGARMDRRFAEEGIAERPTCVTFHGLAASILREFAFATDTSPDVRPIDEPRARVLFSRAYAQLEAGALACDTAAFPYLDRPAVLEQNLARIALDLRDRGIDIATFERRALAAADNLSRSTLRQVTNLDAGKTTRGPGPKPTWPRPKTPLSDADVAAESARERANVRVVAALFRAFDALLAREYLVTFGEVLRRATMLLREHQAIVAVLRARFRHAMVDEYQDTNPAQVAFLAALFGDDLTPVTAVGDLRQAIYEFTGARPEGIVDFAALPGVQTFALTENRRSYQPILDAAHHALAATEAVPLAYRQALSAAREGGGAQSVRVQTFPDREAEAEAIASWIAALVEDGCAPRDIAVLMRARTRAETYAAAIRERGLSVRLNGGLGFYDAAEIVVFASWMRLVETPEDATAAAVVLASTAIGLSAGAIALLAANGDLGRTACIGVIPPAFDAVERARLERYRAVVRKLSTLGAVPLVDAVGSVRELTGMDAVLATEVPLIADRARANVEKFAAIAASLAADRPHARIADLLAEIDERERLDLDEPLAEIAGDRITIATIHGAKGLEWKHVFVANVAPKAFPLNNSDARETIARYDVERGALAIQHQVDGSTSLRWLLACYDVDEETGIVRAEARDDAEEHRLFYVALTRARESVTVTGRTEGAKKQSPSVCLGHVRTWYEQTFGVATHAISPGTMGEAAASGHATLMHAERDAMLARMDARALRSQPSTTPVLRQGTLSYTSLALHEMCPRRARYHYVFDLPSFDDEVPVLRFTEEPEVQARRDPSRFGRIVHRVLEGAMRARIASEPSDIDAFLLQALDEEDHGADMALATAVRATVARALPLLANFTPIAAEAAFATTIAGVAVGGFVDLVARDAAGALVVIDYKTGVTPSERYALQFAVYRHALAEEYGEPIRTVVLRMGPNDAILADVVPADPAYLALAAGSANGMTDDTPRPGIACGACPYRGALCPEGSAA